ncbi:MAG: hypothetical protein HYV63_33905 [Candidatus Schekmanbacteria bacterium]|nr:hypothetical protein [Candidatus Schekmanbacteria bacterium]
MSKHHQCLSKKDAGTELSVRYLLETLKRRRVWVLAGILLLEAAAAGWQMRLPDQYRAELLVVAETMGGPEALDRFRTPDDAQRALGAIGERLLRRSVLADIMREYRLYEPELGGFSEQQLTEMRNRITVQVQGTQTVAIGFKDTSPRRAAQVANHLGQILVTGQGGGARRQAQWTIAGLEAELAAAERNLESQEQKLQALSSRTNSELAVLRARRANLESALRDIDSELEQERRVARAADTGTAMQSAEGRLAALRTQFRELLSRYTIAHPEVVAVQQEMAALEKETAGHERQTGRTLRGLRSRQARLQEELATVNQQLAPYQSERGDTSLQAAINRGTAATEALSPAEAQLVREYDAAVAQRQRLVEELQMARLGERFGVGTGAVLTIAEAAVTPIQPVSPRRLRILAMGLVAGLCCGLGAGLAREHLDTTFRDLEDFRAASDAPVLLAIPTIVPPRRNGVPLGVAPNVVTITNPASVESEQYRILAHAVSRRLAAAPSTTVMVTSAAGAEGKSTTAINLGVALSQSLEGPVLLVDADVRKPHLHAYLHLPLEKGLSELLSNADADLWEYIHRQGNLYVLTGGARQSVPGGSLLRTSLERLLGRLRRRFACIVIDSPPVLPMVDSHVLERLVDGTLFVVRARTTRRELVQRAFESFDTTKLLGVVLNDVSFVAAPYAYAYRYYSERYLVSATSEESVHDKN